MAEDALAPHQVPERVEAAVVAVVGEKLLVALGAVPRGRGLEAVAGALEVAAEERKERRRGMTGDEIDGIGRALDQPVERRQQADGALAVAAHDRHAPDAVQDAGGHVGAKGLAQPLGADERLLHRRGGVALRRQQRGAERRQRGQLAHRALARRRQRLHQAQGVLEGLDRLAIGAAAGGAVAGERPVVDGVVELAASLVVLRDHFGLLRRDLREPPAERRGGAAVHVHAGGAQHAVVGGIAHECVFEGEGFHACRARRHHQAAAHELAQLVTQDALVAAAHRPQQLVAELAAEHGGHLRGLAAAEREAVEAGSEEIAQRRWHRCRAGIGIVGARVRHLARQLLEEQRNPVGALHDHVDQRRRHPAVPDRARAPARPTRAAPIGRARR